LHVVLFYCRVQLVVKHPDDRDVAGFLSRGDVEGKPSTKSSPQGGVEGLPSTNPSPQGGVEGKPSTSQINQLVKA
jgi:hypothetical protein